MHSNLILVLQATIKLLHLGFLYFLFVSSKGVVIHMELNIVVYRLQHMWPLLKAGGGFGTERDVAVVANISARVGSIGDNHLGGWHSYRSSKAALNQCMIFF